MRSSILVTVALLTATATAQNNYYVPSNTPATGTCNVIPFGSTSAGTWDNQKYQTKATVADLGSVAGVITGLGFSPCGTGSIHFDTLEVIIDHHPAGVPMSTTFANNLTASAVTVLSVTDYTWNINSDTWNEIGLQDLFIYNGTDDLIIQVAQTGGMLTGSGAGFHRETTPRLYSYGSQGGVNATTGTLGNAALKWEISMLTARLSTYGVGCAGTNGTPVLSLSGSAQEGGTTNIDLTSGPTNSAAFGVLGFYNGAPFPADLSGLGMPGCFQYIDSVAIVPTVTDGAGSGTVPFAIPATGFTGVKIYAQYACLDVGANLANATSTGYGRILIGQ